MSEEDYSSDIVTLRKGRFVFALNKALNFTYNVFLSDKQLPFRKIYFWRYSYV